MARFLTTFFLMLLFIASGHAQNTSGDLGPIREVETDPAPFIARLHLDKPDTNQINLLCKIARICWQQRTNDNHAVDSTLIFARQAYHVSKDLHFIEGQNEAVFLICKGLLEKKLEDQAISLTNEVYGEELVRLLLVIAESHVFHVPADDKELAKALPLIDKAKNVSEKIQSLRWSSECSNLMSKLRFNQGDITGGKQVIMEVINVYHQKKDYNNEAKYWSRLGTYMPENNNTFNDIIRSRELAVQYYLLADNKKEAGYALRELAVARTNHNQTAQAGKDLTQMLNLFTEIHEPISTTSFYLLSEYYRFTGKYDQALYYGLEGLKAAGNNLNKKINPYIALATIYGILKDYKNAVKYYQMVLDYHEQRNSPLMFVSCYKVVRLKADGGNPREALALLNKFITDPPPVSVNFQQLFASCYGNIYSLLRDYKTAERYYKQMLRLDVPADLENGKNMGTHFLTLTGGGCLLPDGQILCGKRPLRRGKTLLAKVVKSSSVF